MTICRPRSPLKYAATSDIYTLSLHDALPICPRLGLSPLPADRRSPKAHGPIARTGSSFGDLRSADRKSTRLNSSHSSISYAVFCLKKNDEIWAVQAPLDFPQWVYGFDRNTPD